MEYTKPFHLSFHLSWFVVDANDRIVSGPYDSIMQAGKALESWGDAEAGWTEASSHPSYWSNQEG